MIANDARTIVCESMERRKKEIPAFLEEDINRQIAEAAEAFKFKATIPLFYIDDPKDTYDLRENLILYYQSLGYHNVYIKPNNGDNMYEFVLEW